MDWNVESYEDLANAVIERAVLDCRMVLSGTEESYGKVLSIKELERFFRSQWFGTLTKIDGERIISEIRKEFSK